MVERKGLLSDFDEQVRYDSINNHQYDQPANGQPDVAVENKRRFEITKNQIEIPNSGPGQVICFCFFKCRTIIVIKIVVDFFT